MLYDGADPDRSIRVLGAITIGTVNGPKELVGVAPRLIVAELVLSGCRHASDGRLGELLWGDSPAASTSALRVAVSRLRQQLNGTGWTVQRSGLGYALSGRGSTDIEQLVDLERAIHDQASLPEVVALCRSALSLWRGESLSDIRTVDAGAQLAAHLDARRTRLRRTMADAAHLAGSDADFVAEFDAWRRAFPLDELASCALARALGRSGNAAEGLRVLAVARRSLAEVGLVPTEAVRRCEAELVEVTAVRHLPEHTMHAVTRRRACARADRPHHGAA
jgi:DNA-binding SARP family transcriptional activator